MWCTWAAHDVRVAAKHSNARAILGSTKGDHVLADVAGDDLFERLRIGIDQDPLDEVISKLIRSD